MRNSVIIFSMFSYIYRSESFTSAFHLLRAGSCPYFYMCCHQFTVAFFAASTNNEMEAVVTPTSRGFREALKGEDIAFTLPLQPQQSTYDKHHNADPTQKESSIMTTTQPCCERYQPQFY